MADLTKQKNIGDYGTTSVTDTMQVLAYEPGAAEGNRTKRMAFAEAVNDVVSPGAPGSASICQVSITHPSPSFGVSVTGTGNPDLNPADGGYVTVLNGYSEELNSGTRFTVGSDGRVTINADGVVDVTAYADVVHSSNNATVGAVFFIERGGSTIYSPRAVHGRVPNAGDIGNLSGGGTFNAQTGDIVTIALASDITGTVSISSSSLVFRMYS